MAQLVGSQFWFRRETHMAGGCYDAIMCQVHIFFIKTMAARDAPCPQHGINHVRQYACFSTTSCMNWSTGNWCSVMLFPKRDEKQNSNPRNKHPQVGTVTLSAFLLWLTCVVAKHIDSTQDWSAFGHQLKQSSVHQKMKRMFDLSPFAIQLSLLDWKMLRICVADQWTQMPASWLVKLISHFLKIDFMWKINTISFAKLRTSWFELKRLKWNFCQKWMMGGQGSIGREPVFPFGPLKQQKSKLSNLQKKYAHYVARIGLIPCKVFCSWNFPFCRRHLWRENAGMFDIYQSDHTMRFLRNKYNPHEFSGT